ncbi:small VCP/p97-interacting protein-like [Dreissena polymorpha]|uniref:Small VCP/p97-interacting protein n=1 Tax=Dreissena polymorpha TaxID=45954 RepID=A0A9D4HXX8_DREPO|nr:small VCP/p97-interacting protein-like [Dreissena polymorpha]KAH3739465.1 hypothetical protein DPMN_046117 [Dreissena polymorpha]
MGHCMSCCEDSEVNQPSPETRRRELAAAAERRQKENEGRGVKDPEAVKRKQKKKEEMDKMPNRPQGDSNLKWQVS